MEEPWESSPRLRSPGMDSTGPFYRGLEIIVAGREHVVVIPAFLDNLWGSLFSFSGGGFFRKTPQGLRRTVIVAFGSPVSPPITAFTVRQAVIEAGVTAFEHRRQPAKPLETIDPILPHLDHPTLGPLTGSTPDFDRDGVRQTGQKPGTMGHPLPGVALRVVDDAGTILTAGAYGRLLARVAGQPGWFETGYRASIDRDGFVCETDDQGPVGLKGRGNPAQGETLGGSAASPADSD